VFDLREMISPYRSLVRGTLEQFEREHGEVSWSCFAFDSAPAHGRLGLNFDTEANSDIIVERFAKNGPAWFGEDSGGRFNNNCADFTYCRYCDLYLVEEWVEPWEADSPFRYIDLEGNSRSVNQEETGDESFNSIIFSLLTRIRDLELDWVRSNSRNRASPARFGVQMCDSKFEDFTLL
jgi:hypothetical protein